MEMKQDNAPRALSTAPVHSNPGYMVVTVIAIVEVVVIMK